MPNTAALNWIPLSLFLFLLSTVQFDVLWYRISVLSGGVSDPGWAQFLVHSKSLCWWDGVINEEYLEAAFNSNENISVLSTLFCHKSQIALYKLLQKKKKKKISNAPQTSTTHLLEIGWNITCAYKIPLNCCFHGTDVDIYAKGLYRKGITRFTFTKHDWALLELRICQ